MAGSCRHVHYWSAQPWGAGSCRVRYNCWTTVLHPSSSYIDGCPETSLPPAASIATFVTLAIKDRITETTTIRSRGDRRNQTCQTHWVANASPTSPSEACLLRARVKHFHPRAALHTIESHPGCAWNVRHTDADATCPPNMCSTPPDWRSTPPGWRVRNIRIPIGVSTSARRSVHCTLHTIAGIGFERRNSRNGIHYTVDRPAIATLD